MLTFTPANVITKYEHHFEIDCGSRELVMRGKQQITLIFLMQVPHS